MNVYLLINPLLCGEGSKLEFSPEILSQITETIKNDFKKIAASFYLFFTQKLVGLLVKSVDLSFFLALYTNSDNLKMGRRTFNGFKTLDHIDVILRTCTINILVH